MKIALVNPLAGYGRAMIALRRIRKFLSHLKARIRILKPHESIREMISGIGEPEYLIVIGGDGTVRSAVDALLGRGLKNVILVPYLGGSGGELSHYANLLSPENLREAFLHGNVEDIDVYRTEVELSNGEKRRLIFVANLQIGHFAQGIKETPGISKRILGSQGYMIGVMKAIMKRVNKYVTVSSRNFSFSGFIYTIHFGNTSTTRGGVPVAPLANPMDGKLDMMLAKAISRREAIRALPSVLRGKHLSHYAVIYKQFSHPVMISLDNDHVAVDGEYLGLAKSVRIEAVGKIKLLCNKRKLEGSGGSI